jgi:hypothetical protein
MTEDSGSETYTNGANTQPASEQDTPSTPRDIKRALVFVAIAAAFAGLVFAIVRATQAPRPSDPTTERESSS